MTDNFIVYIIIAIIFVAIIAIVLVNFNYNKNVSSITLISSTGSSSTTTQITTIPQNSSNIQSPNLPSCGSNYTLFSTPLFNPNSVLSLMSLGLLVPPDHVFPSPHTGIAIYNPYTKLNKSGAYFYAPGNAILILIGIRNLRNTFGTYKNATDYTLVFQSCKEFFLYIHNAASLIYPPFITAANQLANQCNLQNQTFCQMPTNIPIAAGQVIGTIGNLSKGIQGMDFGARDYRLATGRNFIDPNRLCPLKNGRPNVFDRCYTVCPYSYFTQNIQQQIVFSSADGNVTNAFCGNIYQDVNGTAKGYWFPANYISSTPSEAPDLFLGQDNLNPSISLFSIGTSVPNTRSGSYAFQPRSSGSINRDFSNVTPSNVYCFETSLGAYSITGLSPKVIYLKLINSTLMQIQSQNGTSCGSGPWTIGSNAAKFVR